MMEKRIIETTSSDNFDQDNRALLEISQAYEKLQEEVESRKQTEEALRASEEFKSRLIEGSQDCIKVLDLDGRLLSMNAGGMTVLEICDFAPLRNSPWVDFWHDEFRQAAIVAVETAKAGRSGRFIGYCPTMLGKPRWWDVIVNPIFSSEGKPEKLLAVSRDITEYKQTEATLKEIVQGTASVTGSDFFYSMVQHLAQAIPVKYALVTECADLQKTRARTLAFWNGKAFAENFEYDVKDTTCEKVYQGEVSFYATELQKLFPLETALVDLGAQSYIGLPMYNTAGEFIGHLAVLDDRPMNEPRGLDVLKIFAARAAAELERQKAEQELRKALEEVERLKNRLQEENIYLQEEITKEHNFEEIIGSHPTLIDVLNKVEQVAPTDSTVLILGETGTGKELIARAIHNLSARQNRPLVKVNCAAISAGLVESELFGHTKGAFTGAIEKRIGRFELADGGTIFLDEVGELPPETQVKLLRVLQEGEFEAVGSNRTVKVNVRVIAATNRNMEEMVREGRFRADLYYRLNVFPMRLPALRERISDIPQLAMFFLSHFAQKFNKRMGGIAPETLEMLMNYQWLGNIRELQNIIERGVVISQGSILNLDKGTLPVATPGNVPAQPTKVAATVYASTSVPAIPASTPAAQPASRQLSGTLNEVERQHILSVLEQVGWLIEGERGAAKILNLHPNTLRSRMKKLGLQRPAIRQRES
jgi:formate hydrogenlyase transcriptional activator